MCDLPGVRVVLAECIRRGGAPGGHNDSIPKLVESLLQDDLLDELKLAIHPVAGSGKRLFKDGRAPKRLRLVDSKTTGTGVSILTFRLAGKVESGSFAVER